MLGQSIHCLAFRVPAAALEERSGEAQQEQAGNETSRRSKKKQKLQGQQAVGSSSSEVS